jgi:microcystin-dependent protein
MDPFIGEIRAFAFNFAPVDWATCDGQSIPTAQNPALASIVNTYYGGNSNAFNLPNLQGRAPMNFGNGTGLTPRVLGQTVGATTVTLNANNYPPHNHSLNAVNANANSGTVANNNLAIGGVAGRTFVATNTYQPVPTANTSLAADAVQVAGGAAPVSVVHDNMQPYLPVLLCIALNGIYPERP